MEPDGVVDEAGGGWRGDCLKEDGRKYPSKTNKNTNKECKHRHFAEQAKINKIFTFYLQKSAQTDLQKIDYLNNPE